MATMSNLSLYSLTLQPPTAITHAVTGQFGGTAAQQILTLSGSYLNLLPLDLNRDKIETLVSHNVFAVVRSIAVFRPFARSKDYIILSTDPGQIAILEYLPEQNRLSQVRLETFARSGVHHGIPGHLLAVDLKGRACLVSVKNSKLAYVLDRDDDDAPTIASSPLEVETTDTLVLSLVALDVGHAYPVFASLERNHANVDQSGSDSPGSPELELVYYELNLTTDEVKQMWATPVDPTASLLFAIPGGADGPSGVLVCGDEMICYYHHSQPVRCIPIPKRRGNPADDSQRKRKIVSGTMHQMKNFALTYDFFYLLQTEDGDIFKLTFLMEETETLFWSDDIKRLEIKYFDTIPAATSLCLFMKGYLFAASISGDHGLYQFESLGDDDGEPVFTSKGTCTDPHNLHCDPVFFSPRNLTNLSLVESIGSISPLKQADILDVIECGLPQMYAACGDGTRSKLCMLEHSLAVHEVVTARLPINCQAIWTTKLRRDDQYDQYIVLSSIDHTLVLSIGKEVVETSGTGILASTSTLAVQQMGEDGLIQVHPKGVRHVRDITGDVYEWPAPPDLSIVAAAADQTQLVVALSSRRIVSFTMGSDGSMDVCETKISMPANVTCLCLSSVSDGSSTPPLLAVGCDDCTVRIVRFDRESTLDDMSVKVLPSAPSALHIVDMDVSASADGANLFLYIGLCSGSYLRTTLDKITCELTDNHAKSLGCKPVQLSSVTVRGQAGVLAVGSRSWLGYINPSNKGYAMACLDYGALDWASRFSSEQCEEAIVGIRDNELRIFSIDGMLDNFVNKPLPHVYTPRQVIEHPHTRSLDHYVYSIEAELKPSPSLPDHPGGNGTWASCINIIDPTERKALERIEFEDNEAAICAVVVRLANNGNDSGNFLVVGTGTDLVATAGQFSAGHVYVYEFLDDGPKIKLVHKTSVEEPPTALLGFHGQLLVGMGKMLKLYGWGNTQMVRRAEVEVPASQQIVSLESQVDKTILVADIQQGITLVRYDQDANRLVPFAGDATSHSITCLSTLSNAGAALAVGGDKSGNIWAVRCPRQASSEGEGQDQDIQVQQQEQPGQLHELESVAHFCTHDTPTSMAHTSLIPGKQVLVWTGVQGTIGALVPLTRCEDADFFLNLEKHMRSKELSLVGSDHLAYRSGPVPVKAVIDGDLCEQFRFLSAEKQQAIASELGLDVRQVEQKILDARIRSAF